MVGFTDKPVSGKMKDIFGTNLCWKNFDLKGWKSHRVMRIL